MVRQTGMADMTAKSRKNARSRPRIFSTEELDFQLWLWRCIVPAIVLSISIPIILFVIFIVIFPVFVTIVPIVQRIVPIVLALLNLNFKGDVNAFDPEFHVKGRNLVCDNSTI